MKVDAICPLENLRRFMILSTCQSFIPEELMEDEKVFPERPAEQGTMYVEAEDKETLQKIRDIQFTRVSSVLGVIYNSKSGRTKLKWRQVKGSLGKLTGEASTNTLVNLYATRALDESYVRRGTTRKVETEPSIIKEV